MRVAIDCCGCVSFAIDELFCELPRSFFAWSEENLLEEIEDRRLEFMNVVGASSKCV